MKMHKDEFEIDLPLVQKLIASQFPTWAHLPLQPVSSSGTDNALYRLGHDKVVRLPRIGWALDAVEKEYTWLPRLAPLLPFPIPIPLGKGTPTKDFSYPWAVYTWLEGAHPRVGNLPNATQLAQELALFLKALHHVDLPHGPPSPRGAPLQTQDAETRKALQQLEEMPHIYKITALWEKTLRAPPWSQPPRWVHGDLSPSNLLTHHGHLSAVLDFGISGIGDPACDLLIAWNLLPPSSRQTFRALLAVDDATWERGRGWALSTALIALPYYKDTNPTLANSAAYVISQLLEDEDGHI